MPSRIRGWLGAPTFYLPFAGVVVTMVVLSPYAVMHGADEHGIVTLELSGPAASADAELSGLAWYEHTLVLLPQYPSRFGSDGGALFTLGRREVSDAIYEGRRVSPRPVAFDDGGLTGTVPGFDGFEAIAFAGDDVYLTLEIDASGEVGGYVVKGRVEPPLYRIALDPDTLTALEPQTDIDNLGYEALVATAEAVIVFYEVNGAENGRPRALRFDRDLAPLSTTAMHPLEYRLTDATAVDDDGRFWATNYFFEGDTWMTDVCELSVQYGIGESHSAGRTVERLVELRVEADTVRTVGPPMQLELDATRVGRNWEGIARFRDRGFLVVTDEHPGTMLAYVAVR